MNNPMITIIVPVYNVEHYLNECLNSIEKQSYQDYELSLGDDGSTDCSAEICDAFAKKRQNTSVIHQPNGGLSAARNTGIKSAEGEYLIFVDSDDFLTDNNALEYLVKTLKNTKPDLLIGLPDEYNAGGDEVIIHHSPGTWQENNIYSASSVINDLYRLNGIWVTLAQTKVIKKDFCLSNQLTFYEGIYHEDDEWIARVLLSDPQVAFLYHPWYGYRHRENSIVSSVDSQKVYKRLCDKIKVADSLLTNKFSKGYKEFMRYASDYLLNTIISAGQLSEDKQTEFIAYLKRYRRCYRTIRYSKNMKLRLKAIYITLFGEKRFINHYKG